MYEEVVVLRFNYLEKVEWDMTRNFTIEMGRESLWGETERMNTYM